MKMTKLEQLRREVGLTKSALARAATMQTSVICIIEQGRFRPYDSQLKKIAKVLGVEDPHELLELVEG